MRANDEQFAEQLIGKRDFLIRIIHGLCPSQGRDEAVLLADEVLVNAWEKRDQFNGQNIGAWLGVSARNLVRDKWRRGQASTVHADGKRTYARAHIRNPTAVSNLRSGNESGAGEYPTGQEQYENVMGPADTAEEAEENASLAEYRAAIVAILRCVKPDKHAEVEAAILTCLAPHVQSVPGSSALKALAAERGCSYEAVKSSAHRGRAELRRAAEEAGITADILLVA